LLEQAVIYPHPPQSRRSEAKLFLKDLVGKHKVGVVAIGNGTACRETEELIAEIIAEGTQFCQGEGAAAVAEGAAAAADAAPAPETADRAQAASVANVVSAPDDAATSSHNPVPGNEPIENSDAHAPGTVSDGPTGQLPPELAPEGPVSESTFRFERPWPGTLEDGQVPPLEPAQDGEIAREAHSGSEPHHRQPSEAPVEALPPVSGGAPESASSESDIDMSAGSSPAGDPGAAVLLDEASPVEHRESVTAPAELGAAAGPETPPHQEPAGTEAPGDSCQTAEPARAPESTVLDPESSQPPLAAVVLAAPEQPESSTSEQTPAGPAPTHAEASTPEQPLATVPPSPGPGRPGTPPQGGPLARGAKSPGQPKSDSSRSRPPRNRHTPPPPQAPPKPHPADAVLALLAYVVVNEAGASVYSTSQVGRDELPDSDATLRSGISIGRRLQDPLAELVKIEPQNIGVGLYQHDVNPKQLKDTLEAVISSCVNFVGVDLNTASVPLLRHVSGLNQLTARRIVDYRKEHGPFVGREQLMQVEGVGPATYTQAAGFLKITEAQQPLDRTWVHPESYAVVTRLLEKLGFTPDVVRDKNRMPELRAKLNEVDVTQVARELEIGEFTLRDIIDALARPERDPREDLPKPIFKKGILKIEDLSAGMELKGTVLNVVDFGAFVDIGLKDSGLVHISQLANRYVKSPHDVVSVGDVVTVWVMGVDQERKRVSLTMVKPGVERQRGGGSGSRRGGGPAGEKDREGRAPGQGRRGGGGGRPPRPAASSLTSPPVGAPSVAVLAETPTRRPERDRSGPAPGAPSARSVDPRGPAPGGNPGSNPAGTSPPRQGRGPAPGPPPRGRGGPRGPYPGPPAGPAARQDRGPTNRPPNRPSRPATPPPPLSKDALAGNVPLRTFGQLKQLWEARVEDPPGTAGEMTEPFPQTVADNPPPPPDNQSEPVTSPPAPAPDPEPRPDSSSI
jgi:uncharacterized protein